MVETKSFLAFIGFFGGIYSVLRVFVLSQTAGLFGTSVPTTAMLPLYGGTIGATLAGDRF